MTTATTPATRYGVAWSEEEPTTVDLTPRHWPFALTVTMTIALGVALAIEVIWAACAFGP